MAKDIDIKKLFDLLAERLNNPVNMRLDIRAEVKDIPDSKHGTLTTLVVYNISEESLEDGSGLIDNRIIDDADLYEQGVITEEDEIDIDKLTELLKKIERKEGAYSQDHLTHAENCIRDMSEHAEECLKILEGNK